MSRSTPVQVLHVIGSLDVGGAERVALDLVHAIPSREAAQSFYCLSGREGQLAPQFREGGARVTAAHGPWPVDLVRHLRRRRPDVVVSHVGLASGWVVTAARFMGVRVRMARLHSTGDGRGGAREPYRMVMRQLLHRNATDVVAVSSTALAFGSGIALGPGPRRCVVPNGVDTSRFVPSPHRTGESTIRVVHVGRAAPEKNRSMLPGVMCELARLAPARLDLYGGNTDLDLGHYDRSLITNHGAVDDVPGALRNASVLVLPSLREGLPGAVLEALATGVPVVASDIPALRELGHLTGVHLVPLSAPAAIWAEALLEAGRTTPESRALIREGLLDSPFSLPKSAAWWRTAWATC